MKKTKYSKIICYLLVAAVSYIPFAIQAQDSASEYVKKAWAMQGQGDFTEAVNIASDCIHRFSSQAEKSAESLNDFPPKGEEDKFDVMNSVATCYYIMGETFRNQAHNSEGLDAKKLRKKAIGILRQGMNKYPYAQAFDPRGWYWSIKDKSIKVIEEIERGGACEAAENVIQKDTRSVLYDEGEEFPVDYEKYGEFTGINTPGYRYKIIDPIGLGKAVGEGIYPNSTSVKFNPEFVSVKKELPKIDHWQIINTRDLKTAFYKWNIAPEPQGVRQFYIADILERSGHLRHAVKAYYALIIHFPNTYGWTYWHTPWYPAKAAIYRINHILAEHPELGLKLDGTSIHIINGYDNNIRNDRYVVNPGRLAKRSLVDKLRSGGRPRPRKSGKIIDTKGGDKTKLVKYESGDWSLLVDDKPFIIKGVTYGPSRVGESPDQGTLANWTIQDSNENGLVDGPYEAWVDINKNNIRDDNEKNVGDFHLMKEMGVNTLRLYHQPDKLDKQLLRQMHEKYGIYVIMGDFIGKYVLGSGADWENGTDYDDPVQRKNMLQSVKEMVMEFKDEPYVIIWLLGNENVYGLGCNADKKPESFFSFANEAAFLIKSLDPLKRPVAIDSGDTLYLDIFSEKCPDIDIFGTNAYRGRHGFSDLWQETKNVTGKPAMVTEFGAPSYGDGYTLSEAEDYQAAYHEVCWHDIYYNSCGFGEGNSLGGFVFEWLDEWWKAYNPSCHDNARLSAGPFLDGYYREEWFGLCGQGDGKHSPFMRHLKKSYFIYKKLWN